RTDRRAASRISYPLRGCRARNPRIVYPVGVWASMESIIPLAEVLSTVHWSGGHAALISATGVESPPGSLSVGIWRRLSVLSRSDFRIAPARGAQAYGMNMG